MAVVLGAPLSLLDDDFEVISVASNSISPFDMSLAQDTNSAVQQLEKQLTIANERWVNVQQQLKTSNAILTKMVEKQKQPSRLVADLHQAQLEITILRNCQEELQQKSAAYLALQKQVDQLITAKERLENDKKELTMIVQQYQTSSTEKTHVVTTEAKKIMPEEEATPPIVTRIDIQELNKMKERVAQLEALLESNETKLRNTREENDQLKEQLSQTEQHSLYSDSKIDEMQQSLSQLMSDLGMEQAKLIDAQERHSRELDDLRQSSQVRQLDQLRWQLEQGHKREAALARRIEEGDQTVREILQAATGDSRAVLTELVELKRLKNSLGVTLEQSNAREVKLRDEAMDAAIRLNAALEEKKKLQGQLCNAQLLQEATDRDLTSAQETAASLRSKLAQQEAYCAECDKTVADVLSDTEAGKRQSQLDLERESQLRQYAESQLRAVTAAKAEASAAAESFRRHRDSLELQLDDARREQQRLRQVYEEMQRCLAEKISQEDKLKATITEAEESALVLRDAVELYRRDFEHERQEKLQLRTERDCLHAQVDRVRSAFNDG